MKGERILFVYFDAGAGHRSVAEAVADAMQKSPRNRHSVQLLEFFRETGLSKIELITKDLYNEFLLKHPFLYALYYHLGNSPLVIRLLYKLFIDQQFWNSIEGIIEKHDPRMCVLVNPHLCECFYRVVSKRARTPVLVNLVSDPFSVHSLWLSPNADYNLLFSEEARKTFIKKGIPELKLRSFDYPLHMKFTERVHSRNRILAKYLFCPEIFTILIYAGRHNIGLVQKIVKKMLEQNSPIQAFVVLGKTLPKEDFFGKAEVKDEPCIRLFDFMDEMDELTAASDLIVCKAGPAVIFEAINMKKPMVIVSYVPGQEGGNLDYILRENFGWYCNTADEFMALLSRILDDRSLIEEKRRTLEMSAVSNGTPKIAEFLIDLLSEQQSFEYRSRCRGLKPDE